MKYSDFRSDTVTLPTENMYKAMNQAVLGDDVYDDDPTVKELEEYAARLLGKEAALFVPSGTFCNQVALLTHTKRGDEIIVGEQTHILQHEVGAAAVISGITIRPVPELKGLMEPEEIKKRIRGENIHFPRTSLICIENAHSLGTVIPAELMKEIKALADENEIPVHMDGARFFNAAAALEISVKEMAGFADTINICLSKGLCAPAGSLLLGSSDFIEKAKKNRKLLGGGMRQAGILAAPGLVALKEMTGRLAGDHENARYLAGRLEEIQGLSVNRDCLDINMVFFTLSEAVIPEQRLVTELLKGGYKINGTEGGEYRFVTNQGVGRRDIDGLIDAMKKSIEGSINAGS